MKNLGLIPLRNFGIIEPGKIYRSAQPLYSFEYNWLEEALGINMIVNLRKESKHDRKMLAHHKMVVLDVDVPDHGIPTEWQVEQFIHLIKSGDHFPLLIHCEHGRGRTSTFSVLARIAMGWTVDDAIKEEREKFHYAFQHHVQENFLKTL